MLLSLVAAPSVFAQDESVGWVQKAGFELLFNQGFYSDNWTGDEKTSGSLTASLGHTAQRQLADPVRLEHELALAFGEQAARRDSASGGGWEVNKSEDRIRLDDALRFTLGLWVDPLLSIQLKSQFVDKRDTTQMYWVNPVQLLEAAGFGRKFFDDSTRTLTSELGAAARQLFDRADTLTVSDAGISWITALKTIVGSPNADYASRLTLYKPLLNLGGETELGTWPQVDWEHTLSARFNKVLSGKVYVQLLFDEIVDQDIRFKQTLGMGLSLAWPSAE
jgi:hypothetical protein